MKTPLVPVLLVGFLSGFSGPSVAQTPPTASIEAMKKLDFLIGSWQGDGWIQMGPGKRRSFTQNETVQSKLGGLLITIDGLGKGSDPDDRGKTVHNAFAVVSYDHDAEVYRWRAYTADGRSIDTEAKLTGERTVQWGFAGPQGVTIRYTMDLSQPDHWHEVGEYSMDGKNWMKFFEMSLQRAK